MPLPDLSTDRFTCEAGYRISVQVPEPEAERLIAAVLGADALNYGDYDRVTFCSAPGLQGFRSLGTGRNAATGRSVSVACIELSFFLPEDEDRARTVLGVIYDVHPYEEPVVFVQPCLRCLHIRGADEDNPNRFWNRPAAQWIPEPHR